MAPAGKFLNVVTDFLKPSTIMGGTRYFDELARSAIVHGADPKKVALDLAGDRRLWRALNNETAWTVQQQPTLDEFDAMLRPMLTQYGDVLGTGGGVSRQAYDVDPGLGAAGLRAPTGALAKKDGDGKLVVDIDKQLREMIGRKDYDTAIKMLYDELSNVARLTPESMVEQAQRLGSIFYPLRTLRNTELANRLNVDKRVIDALTSINSAQAGPFIEQTRTLALLPFIRATDNGLIFDRTGARRVLGDRFIRSPGISSAIKAIETGELFNPNMLEADIPGLAAKTFVYDILAKNPNQVWALVADTIGAGGRAGRGAMMPSNQFESLLGQIPERVLARRLGIPNSAAQEINWFISRILRGESSSNIPFESFSSPEMLGEALAGRRLVSPHSGKFIPTPADELGRYELVGGNTLKNVEKRYPHLVGRDKNGKKFVDFTRARGDEEWDYIPSDSELNANLSRYLGQRGSILDDDARTFINQTFAAFDNDVSNALAKSKAGQALTAEEQRLVMMNEIVDGKVVPSTSSIEAVISPKHRTPEFVKLTKDVLDQINMLPPTQAKPAARELMGLIHADAAALIALLGGASLGVGQYVENRDKSPEPMEYLARRQAARNLYGGPR